MIGTVNIPYQLLSCSVFTLLSINSIYARRYLHKRKTPSAFSLARLQRDYEDDYENDPEFNNKGGADGSRRRDDVVSDTKCLQRCNNRLNIGMDMVNHRDLNLFCLLDRQHSQCIDECGYSVQFNLREYVCRHRFGEVEIMLKLSDSNKWLITIYFLFRCRQLLCDHACVNFILGKVCESGLGKKAANFLLDFTRLQVEYWVQDFAKSKNLSPTEAYPSSCARLQCDDFHAYNCTRIYGK
uniref:Apple domain-containing protein n=1 Tax=Heterorhabditis bacteriophora TaxID=37862 RepID=A0A1I7W7F9_HETBA